LSYKGGSFYHYCYDYKDVCERLWAQSYKRYFGHLAWKSIEDLKKPSASLQPKRSFYDKLEADAARWIREDGNQKPVVSFIAGQTAPPGRRMGHAGAIIGGKEDTAEAKMRIMKECGLHVVASPAAIGAVMKKVIG